MVTDLDVWAAECPKCGIVSFDHKCEGCNAKPLAVSIEEILETMEKNAKNLKALLEAAIPKIPTKQSCYCPNSMNGAVI
jgi:purine nucleoside phosphorylase